MKFNKKTLSESIQSELTGTKTFTEGKRQDVVISEEQLERLLSVVKEDGANSLNSLINEAFEIIRDTIVKENLDLNVEDYSNTILEQSEWYGGRNPGVAAGEGLENIVNAIKKAYAMFQDSDMKKKLHNTITKINNNMAYTAELIGSGRDQRSARSFEDIADDLPYPEFEEGGEEVELEVEEGKDVLSKMKTRRKEVGEDKLKESQKEKERLIQEDIKKMKQIIKPISRS